MANTLKAFIHFGVLTIAVLAQPAFAQDQDFPSWLQNLEQESIASGISSEAVHSALDNVLLDERVLELDSKQPETTATFESYVAHTVSAERLNEGRDLLEINADILHDISREYGVPPQIIVALWGVESSFGHFTGNYEVIDSLVSLAYQGRRANFFRGQVMDALRILDRDHLTPDELRGSWAGAMGQCQFMPSTYLKYAVDYDHGGRRDIWANNADIFASIANYLASEGWGSGLGWGREVELEEEVDPTDVGLDHRKTMAEWAEAGLRNLDRTPLPRSDLETSLVQPDGPTGRSFLVTDNYRALMRWNRSTYFATAVGLLADGISR